MSPSQSTTTLSKKDYEKQVNDLRAELIQLQVDLKQHGGKILLIVAGLEGSGRGDVINTLGGWLDPRGVETFSYHDSTDEEKTRPFMWRFWNSLPPSGKIGIYAGSWYTETLRSNALRKKKAERLELELSRIRHFEKLLTDDDTLIIKIWVHLEKHDLKARLHRLANDPRTAWKVTGEDKKHLRTYDQLEAAAKIIRTKTDQPSAHWTVIEGNDERNRDLDIARLIIKTFHQHQIRIARRKPTAPPPAMPKSLRTAGLKQLRALPLDQKLSSTAYETKRDKWLARLSQAVRTAKKEKIGIVFAFEGWDAAGKGGAIRRLTSAIDVRDYRVIPVAKPTDEEKSHHYLWRFWRHIPRDGFVTIYDRSWYGRVLVERLEGFCRPDEWKRAFQEINDFEEQLTFRGLVVVKFWMHVSKEEQLARFQSRQETPHKQHKINDEDWRNREKWEPYEIAVGDMLALTHRPQAPWCLIPSNNKRYARLEILKQACKQIEKAIARKQAAKSKVPAIKP